MRQNGVYRVDCLECKEANIMATYFGESAMTLFDRGLSSGLPTETKTQKAHWLNMKRRNTIAKR